MTETKPILPPETQQQRWVKYGANVALSIIVGIALVVLFTYIAEARDKRIDTTAEGVYSLKPQTLSIIQNLKSPIKIVSLYSKESNREDIDTYAQTVQDLLDEYRASGKDISIDFIDPLNQPAKADALINEVTTKYGGEVKAYREFLDQYTKTYDDLKKKIADEDSTIHAVNFDAVNGQSDLGKSLMGIVDAIDQLPDLIDQVKDNVDRKLKQKPPDYKGAVDAVQQNMDDLSQEIAAVQQEIGKDKTDKGTPDPVKTYLTDCEPRFVTLKKIADDLDDQAKKLGDLKLDTLRQSLKEKDSILVMGENDMRVLPFDQVWKSDEETIRQYAKTGKIRPQFAGEQLITTAIYGLTQPKHLKVVFVRPGGAPLTDPGMPPFQAGGPLSQAADRLRQYNFDVEEKDISGQYAQQAEEQGQPPAPEASDADMQDAIWVVIAAPTQNNNGPMGPMPSPMGPKLLEHLDAGGSAFILPFPEEQSPVNPLKALGIDLRVDAVAVHETPAQQGASDDPAQQLQQYPFIFDIRNYGDSPITRPLRSLDSLFYPVMLVSTHDVKDVKVTPLLPVPGAPNAPACWGDTDLTSLAANKTPTFDPKVDIAPPLFGGASAEKANGQRVVVIGSPEFIFNQTLQQVDPDLARKRIFVPEFPGNLELFTNCMFWLAHQDSMIAISPAAMQVQRIADMSDATLNAWRVGVLLVGLPGLVIVAGFMMYFARRD